MTLNYTRLENGSLAFHRRGRAPPDLPNYTRDPKDEYLFHPNFPTCSLRVIENKHGPCGKITGQRWACKSSGDTVSVSVCNSCNEREP